MTKVHFNHRDGKLCGFTMLGHAGYAQEGEDIVCAAVSSAAYMAANTITEVLSSPAQAEVSDACFRFSLLSACDLAVAILEGLKLHLSELQKQYPAYLTIDITEV